ncbi:acyl CoA:acetate/3-ketoacid CoA transferase [Accumulibacter sp.]|uniref:acyl CoA:acetate/3-ketoacid CoA transferase n=1 Tax=Accumulibacter sp. TaxID=2053492 RepID=UPI0025D3D111|nr:malonate decarboxylase subunit alpha [Accumulibacter sp.]MCM8594015.1 malonate decarboxylase subunit alpha [Accumulibacter sp.]MCM8627572.1 malonate decarboxylase subunit alpha [Accumulibacter sp.]MDS4048157.1 malonate decarboxylase subunit alpha [Accumulibacter sp.]
MRSKIVTADEAIALIRDGDTLASTGFVQTGFAEALLSALERRHLATGGPRNLALFAAAGQGDGKSLGLNHLGHVGLLRRVVAGHWGRMPKVAQLALDNSIQAYNLPQGIICQLFRDLAAGKPGTFSKVGLHTFVDPRYGGGRINAITTKDIVSLVEVEGEEWLFYRVGKVDVAFIRGTTADTFGNITMEREALTLNNLAMAMAAKNSNGIVIAQVERIAERSCLPPRQVKIPGMLVDCIVVAEPAQHMQTLATPYSPAYAGEFRVPAASVVSTPLSERKLIARRAAFELPPNGIINLGVGMPEGVATVVHEERISHLFTLTVESGLIGGIPSTGGNFGTGVNMDAVIDENQQFDFYDGGGLDMACLGMAECDASGSVNVSRFGGRLVGAGGFINITQNARLVVFVGTFTGNGLKVAVEDGKLRIVEEGRQKKFVRQLEQITFNGQYAYDRGKPVYYVTERCVFRRMRRGLALIEVAPGIDVARDILPQMEFEPIIGEYATMDPRIFNPDPMGLERELLNLSMPERVTYDQERNILFLNFEGMYVRVRDDVQAIWDICEERCRAAGRRVGVIINYDRFRISQDMYDAYAEMDRYFLAHYFSQITRYATSAFLRAKLGEAFSQRSIAPHVFERREEAQAFLNTLGADAGDVR